MRLLDKFLLRLRSLFSRDKVEEELNEELRYHLERQMDEGIAAGLSPENARYAALRIINDIEQRKEECRDARRLNLIENFLKDLRYAFRMIRRSSRFRDSRGAFARVRNRGKYGNIYAHPCRHVTLPPGSITE